MVKKSLLSMMLSLALALTIPGLASATSVSISSPTDGSDCPSCDPLTVSGVASGTGVSGTGLDLILVMDESGSMSSWSGGQTRLEWAQDAALALVQTLFDNTNTQFTTDIGVIGFDTNAQTHHVLSALSSDKGAIDTAINGLTDSGYSTYIGYGIDAASAMLSAEGDPTRVQMMIVLSDGQSSGSPTTSAATAYASGHTVHTVGIPGHSASTMQAIATAGNGTYNDVSDLTTLEALFDGTGGSLVGLDRVELNGFDVVADLGGTLDSLGNWAATVSVALGANPFTAVAFDTNAVASSPDSISVNGVSCAVPEPGTLLLLGSALMGMIGYKKKESFFS